MTLHPIEAGNFKLDGGAMFGVVPKSLWQKTNTPDSNNMIDMACRCLLIENGNKLTLVDTGMGTKQSEKFFGHYYRWGGFDLISSINKAGFSCDEITDVFLHIFISTIVAEEVLLRKEILFHHLYLKTLHIGAIKIIGRGQPTLTLEKKHLFLRKTYTLLNLRSLIFCFSTRQRV